MGQHFYPSFSQANQRFIYTPIFLKPDALARMLEVEIIRRLEKAQIFVVHLEPQVPSEQRIRAHYCHLSPLLKERNVRSLAGKRILVGIASGDRTRLRALIGDTDPSKAACGTIRGDLGQDSIKLADQQDRALNNLIHAADNDANAQRELQLWLPHIYDMLVSTGAVPTVVGG